MIPPLQIELSAVEKHYGSYHALKNINLAVPKGSFVALVGPSGCGKSTLLRALAGLETITSGEMKITGVVVNTTPPRKRNVAMVFQSYALYPHMTVRENLTYSMRIQRKSKAEKHKAADEVAATTGLSELLDRYPRELSGGQRQRVAMGRAIIRDPAVFLFDEPLSNLDAALRVKMRKEVRALHDRLGATTVYVTHDQVEAMTMADHVVVLRDGKIEQQGSPMSLYDSPNSTFVAGFVGSPAMNFVDGRGGDDGASVILNMPGTPSLQIATPIAPGRQVTVGLRPEHLKQAPTDAADLTVAIGQVETTGSATYISAESGDFTISLTDRFSGKIGENINLSIDPSLIHLFEPSSGLALT